MSLEKIFRNNCASRVATAKHLPYLKEMAGKCTSIWELGVKCGHSSSAFLAGLPPEGRLFSVDLVTTNKARQLKKAVDKKRWRLFEGNSIDYSSFAGCATPDLIFFDSLHTYKHLRNELSMWGNESKKWLVFHDTITFATMGANLETGTYLPQPDDRSCFDPASHGIRLAIDQFMSANPHWIIQRHAPYGHGLLTLVRG